MAKQSIEELLYARRNKASSSEETKPSIKEFVIEDKAKKEEGAAKPATPTSSPVQEKTLASTKEKVGVVLQVQEPEKTKVEVVATEVEKEVSKSPVARKRVVPRARRPIPAPVVQEKQEVQVAEVAPIPTPLVEEKSEATPPAMLPTPRRSAVARRQRPKPKEELTVKNSEQKIEEVVQPPVVEEDVSTEQVAEDSGFKKEETNSFKAPIITIKKQEVDKRDKEAVSVRRTDMNLQEKLLEDSEEDFDAIESFSSDFGSTGKIRKVGRKSDYQEVGTNEGNARVKSQRKDVYDQEENNPFSSVLPNDLASYTLKNHVLRFWLIGLMIVAGIGVLLYFILAVTIGAPFAPQINQPLG